MIKAILVDDEERARDVLSNLLDRFCPDVQILAGFSNLPDAVEGIKSLKPDLVFLDIEMPNHAGYEILNYFDKIDFNIIFVTAFDSYAVRAFEVSAMDYLLKPIEIERLKGAVEKVKGKLEIEAISNRYDILKESLHSNAVKNLVVSERGDQHIIPVESILAIEAQEAYSKIYTVERKYVASKNLKQFERLLEGNKNFFRTHKSWIINLDLVHSYNRSTGDIQLSGDIVAKLSKYRKEAFEAILV